MADDSVVNALDSVPARLQRVEKAFSDLDSQRALLANSTTVWKELEDFFAELHTTIQSKMDEFAQKQKDFTAKIEEEKLALGKRTEVLPTREKTSLARVKEQKDAAIATIMEERRKWIKDHVGNGFSEITASSRRNIRSLKSKRQRPSKSKSMAVDRQTNSSLSEEQLRRRLKSCCDNMDGKQLWKFLVSFGKKVSARSDELRCALQSSSDPVRLVLKALESYRTRPPHPDLDNDTGVLAMRYTCIFLLETLSAMIANPGSRVDHPVISSDAKDSARAFARSWRSEMDIHGDATNVNALDAQAFLQLLAIFDIASEYKEDELLKLIPAIAGRRQTPAICRSLGLSAMMPDLVDKLAKDGKQMEALSLANSFGIMDKIQQVSLLKEFLKDVRVASHLTLKKAASAGAGQSEAIIKEQSALKAVLKAVKEYKLGSQYPTDNLQKRLRQLGKAKEEEKRATTFAKPPKKRRRLNVMAPAPATSMPIAPSVSTSRDNLPVHRPSEREHFERGHFGEAFPLYDMPMRSGYDRQPQGGIDPVYATGTRSSLLAGSYLYPSDERGSAYGSTTSAFGSISDYSTLSGLYGGYQYAGALPSTYQLARPSAYHSESAHPSAYQSFTR